ncbi:MAG TPA: protein O-GlcNAcase [Gemmatimonadales bacterium]
MSFEVRGLIEGFYGRPWSWQERERMVEFLDEQGYNLYVYAPKNDPLHRNRWQEPYLPEEMDRFAALARLCRRHGVEFAFGLSPLNFRYTEAGLEVVWRKLAAMHRRGIRGFALLVDDMPERFHDPADGALFPSLAAAQVWLANGVLERLEALGGGGWLIFCPTEYCGEGVSDYLRTLGEGLRPEIDVFWTGPEVCSPELRVEDARRVGATLKRPVLYWDNYPVNDEDMRFRPHIRPVRGRDPDLYTACRGIVANGSLQPEATRIALHTYAQYFADPIGYEPEAAWQKALLAVTGNREDAEALAVLGDLTRWSALERGRQLENRLAPVLARFWELWGGPPASAGPDLPGVTPGAPATTAGVAPGTPAAREAALAEGMAEFSHLHAVARRLLDRMANRRLQAELRPWAGKLEAWAEVGLLALGVLQASLKSVEGARLAGLRNAVLDRLLAARENFHWVAGDMVDHFARRCLWAAGGPEREELGPGAPDDPAEAAGRAGEGRL